MDPTDDQYLVLRQKMVQDQLYRRGIKDPVVLKAMETVPRHAFVPQHMLPYAYEDGPLSIGEGQTISQPYIVAYMVEAAQLTPESRVLEIGTGSGYAAAVASRCAKEVYTVERIPSLAERATGVIEQLGYDNVHVLVGDGSKGWAEHAPYDAVIVTAGAPVVPEQLVDQVVVGGGIIIPVGDLYTQQLIRVSKNEKGDLQYEGLLDVRFVPLIGEDGWQS